MHRSIRSAGRATAAATLIALAACGGDEPTAAPATTAPATAAATSPTSPAPAATSPAATAPGTTSVSAPAAPVPSALQFRAPLVGGGEIDAATYAGQPVLFWFWAPY